MGLFDKVANEVGKAGAKVVDAGAKAAEDAKKEAEKAAAAAEAAARKAADEAKKAADKAAADARKTAGGGASAARDTAEAVGAAVGGAVSNLGGEIRRAAQYAERLLTEKEKGLARKVFGDSLPYGAVYLSNGLGFEQRPYTIPHPLHLGSYVIHIGPKVFPDATDSSVTALNMKADVVFIHELTHVWQGVHRKTPFDYVFDSVHAQAAQGSRAYDLDPSKVGKEKWDKFGAEQQAKIVEGWYARGMKTADPEFRYIRDNIRPGKDSA